MRNLFTSKARYTATNIAFHAGTAVLLTAMSGSVFVKSYEDCQESFKNNPWIKDNPHAYQVKESSNPIKQYIGLENFNVKASLQTIVKLEDEIDGMGLCVNTKITRENAVEDNLNGANPPSPYGSPSGAP